jgi:hypothetical protein
MNSVCLVKSDRMEETVAYPDLSAATSMGPLDG